MQNENNDSPAEITDEPLRSDIQIDNGVATWTLNTVGDIQGSYVGQFKFKCYLDPMSQIAADRSFRELLGQNPLAAPQHESFLAYCISQLKYRIISAPPFWNTTTGPGNIPDEEVLSMVLDAAVASEVIYKKTLKKKKLETLTKAKEAVEAAIKRQNDDILSDE